MGRTEEVWLRRMWGMNMWMIHVFRCQVRQVCVASDHVSHVLWRYSSLYRCRLFRRTPCVCSPVVDGNVLIVVVRECVMSKRCRGRLTRLHKTLGRLDGGPGWIS